MRVRKNLLQVHPLKTNKLVVGYSLQALQYAKTNNAVLLVNGELKPHRIEQADQFRKWNSISFKLGLAGLTPIPSKIESISVEEKTVSVFTEFYKKIQIVFNELYLFDLERVRGLPLREEVSEYLVYDWFDIKRGARQPNCKILSPDSFVNELVFYPSLRHDSNSGENKDCYAKSYIKGDELGLFENSETAARLAALSKIKKNGLKGPARNINEKVHYLNIVLEHSARHPYKHKKKYIISDSLPEYVYCYNIHT